MRDISEKVSYLQGLCEGLNISGGSPQGKIIAGMLEVLEEIGDAVTHLQYQFEEFKDYVESIDDDLFDLEESILDEEDFIEFDCSSCGEHLYLEADVLDEDDTLEIICPSCNEVVFVHEGSFDYDPAYIENEFTDIEDEIENPSPS
ncbi:CD1247 N-terminal domain-containing protein [Syntrophomonas erecta]